MPVTPAINWDCWIGDESGGSRIWFKGTDQPKPIPLPECAWEGTISGLLEPGAFRVDSAGFGPKKLVVNLSLEFDVWESLEALLQRFTEDSEEDGPPEHLPVQFYNSFHTYRCTPIGELKPTLPNKRPPKVAVTVTLLVNETLS